MSCDNEYESIMHIIADKLMDQFEGSDAVNYIEQTFENKDNPSKSFVLTMQMKEGLTPCEKLAEAEKRIESQLKLLSVAGCEIGRLDDEKAGLESVNNLLIKTLMYYADKTIYTDGDVPMHVYALDDAGSIARKALGFTESEADHVEIRNRRFTSEG